MGAILMDKWSFDCVMHYLTGEDLERTPMHARDGWTYETATAFNSEFVGGSAVFKSWLNFLTVVTLWDEVWSFAKQYNLHYGDDGILKDMSQLIHEVDRNIIDRYRLGSYEALIDDTFYENAIKKRTYYYQLISNYLGVPFFAHPSRERFIVDELETRIFSRLDIMRIIDKELLKFYREVNMRLGSKRLVFKYPVLTDFILRESNSPLEQLKIAMELRNERDVIAFREQISSIESIVNGGNYIEILAHLDMITDIAHEMINIHKIPIRSSEITISLTPSISFPIESKGSAGSTLHTTFINRLLDYGLTKRVVRHHNDEAVSLRNSLKSISSMISKQPYRGYIPSELEPYHYYVSDYGHCIMCVLQVHWDKACHDDTRDDFEQPIPVKYVVLRGYRIEDGYVIIDAPYSDDFGLLIGIESCDFEIGSSDFEVDPKKYNQGPNKILRRRDSVRNRNKFRDS